MQKITTASPASPHVTRSAPEPECFPIPPKMPVVGYREQWDRVQGTMQPLHGYDHDITDAAHVLEENARTNANKRFAPAGPEVTE